MSTKQPRLHLFSGSDSRASFLAISHWQKLFEQKYGVVTKYVIDTDELSVDEFSKELEKVFQSNTLFSEPKLIIIKRITAQEKGKSQAFSKLFIELMNRHIAYLDQNVTVAIWEPRNFTPTHPLFSYFTKSESESLAKLHTHLLPSSSQVVHVANNYLALFDCRLSMEAEGYLKAQYSYIEQNTRLALRLKYDQQIEHDERSWWLYQLLDGAVLRCVSQVISLDDLQAGHQQLGQPVSVFEISKSVAQGNFIQSLGMLKRYMNDSHSADWYSLLAALEWQFSKQPGRFNNLQARQAIFLLAQIELLAKNINLDLSWLLQLYILRLQDLLTGDDKVSLLSGRKLWLSQLARH